VGVGTIPILVIAVSLAIDAVHYPTDIAASIVWSLALAPASRLVWVDWVMPRIPFLALPDYTTETTRAGEDGRLAPSRPRRDSAIQINRGLGRYGRLDSRRALTSTWTATAIVASPLAMLS
jgi:hypothetical protein